MYFQRIETCLSMQRRCAGYSSERRIQQLARRCRMGGRSEGRAGSGDDLVGLAVPTGDLEEVGVLVDRRAMKAEDGDQVRSF